MALARFDTERLEAAWRLLAGWCADGTCTAAAAVVGSHAEISAVHAYGVQRPDGTESLADNAIFLIASPTKPLTATAVMLLVEEGAVRLNDPVAAHVPEFAKKGKRAIRVAHLLTHTSGLPDMLPHDSDLRAAEAPLDEFVHRACRLKPDFSAGRSVQYQSMGFLMLGEIVRRVAGKPLPEFLRERVFAPLGMHDTSLGMPPAWRTADAGAPPRESRIAVIRTDEEQFPGARVWNGDYWRTLGAPWGGLLSTASDLGRWCQHLLAIHRGHAGVLRPATLAAMTRNQLAMLPDVPEVERRARPWGLGWQLNWPHHPTSFGDLLSPAAYGHWGATGTLVWLDPATDAFVVVLTTEPRSPGRRFLAAFSNAVCAALA